MHPFFVAQFYFRIFFFEDGPQKIRIYHFEIFCPLKPVSQNIYFFFLPRSRGQNHPLRIPPQYTIPQFLPLLHITVINRPGQSQELFLKDHHIWYINSVVRTYLGHSKSKRIYKFHYWFKSYKIFTGWVDLAFGWVASPRLPPQVLK